MSIAVYKKKIEPNEKIVDNNFTRSTFCKLCFNNKNKKYERQRKSNRPLNFTC